MNREFSDSELQKIRAETAGVANVIHFNNAGSSLSPDAVHFAVVSHLERERQIGGYEAKEEAAAQVDRFYGAVAQLINCTRQEVAFVENATRAWDMAFYSLPLADGDEIITANAEYASNYLAYLQLRKRKNIAIKVCPDDSHGQIDTAALRHLITKRTKLIAITHVPTQGGLVNPAEEVGKIAREFGVLYLLDACQSLGQLEVDVKKIGCHVLSGTGRKFLRGPRGTGLLYVEQELANRLDPAFIDLHSAKWTGKDSFELESGAKRFENWECHFAGKIGLGVAIDYANALGMSKIETRNGKLAGQLRDKLSEIPGVSLTDLGARKSAIVTFAVQGMTPQCIRHALREKAMNVSVSSAADAMLDLAVRGHQSVVRASLHYYNTEHEIDEFCATLAATIRR